MSTIRAFSLTVSALLLLACSDDGGLLTAGPQPGQLTGSCIEGQCLPGLMCFVDKCQPAPGKPNTSNDPPDDPTTGGSTDGTESSSTTDGVTSGNPPVDSTTTSGTATTNPPDPSTSFETSWDSGDDSNFITPPGTDTDAPGEACGITTCTTKEHCVSIDGDSVCLRACDPLDGGSCDDYDVCAWYQNVFACVVDASGNGGAVGEPCFYANDCNPIHTCLNGQAVAGCSSGTCCSVFCDIDSSTICNQFGMECVAWYEQGSAPAGLEDLGVCLLPS